MSNFEFRLPDVGEGVAEGEIVAWHVEPGQNVAEDQEMVEVMTDKATVSIGAPRAGRIVQLHADVGEVVKVGSVIVEIDTQAKAGAAPSAASSNGNGSTHAGGNGGSAGHAPSGDLAVGNFQAPASMPPQARERAMRNIQRQQGQAAAASAAPAQAKQESAATAVGDIKEDLPGMAWLRSQTDAARSAAVAAAPAAAPAADEYFQAKPLATPATRKLARDMGVDLRHVRPSGPGGRVTKEDVRGFAGGGAAAPARARTNSDVVVRDDQALEERTPFVGLRRRIAQRMHDATTKPAVFTFVEEVEVDRLSQLVDRLRPAADAQGIKLHYLPFIVKAVTLALKKHPMLNSMLDEQTNELVMRRYYHIGIATATEHGLVVPVVRDADKKNPLQIASEIQTLAAGARSGGLAANDLSGSTFTITSLGKRGGLLATPVLNYPEVGILGVHRMRQKPVVRNGEIAVGQVMMLSLSLDHRIVDGDVGAAFAYDVIAYLENPDLLLLEMH